MVGAVVVLGPTLAALLGSWMSAAVLGGRTWTMAGLSSTGVVRVRGSGTSVGATTGAGEVSIAGGLPGQT